jgi:hypothetical protein
MAVGPMTARLTISSRREASVVVGCMIKAHDDATRERLLLAAIKTG